MNVNARRDQRGISLVEILLSLTLGLIVVGGIIQIFVGSRATYETSDALSRLEENGRFALATLSEDMRLTGYNSCTGGNAGVDPADAVAGGGTGVLAYPLSAVIGVDGGNASDSLTLRFASAVRAALAVDTTAFATSFVVDAIPAAADWDQNTVLAIAGCQNTRAYVVASVAGTTINLDPSRPLPMVFFQGGDEVFEVFTANYAVGDTGRTNSSGDPIFALYKGGEELVEGVEHMQIQYGVVDGGVGSTTSTIRFVDWDGSFDLDQVKAIRLGLLMHSIERVLEAPDSESKMVAGVEIKPAGAGVAGPTFAQDRRLRRVYSTTVQLRNRGEGE